MIAAKIVNSKLVRAAVENKVTRPVVMTVAVPVLAATFVAQNVAYSHSIKKEIRTAKKNGTL